MSNLLAQQRQRAERNRPGPGAAPRPPAIPDHSAPNSASVGLLGTWVRTNIQNAAGNDMLTADAGGNQPTGLELPPQGAMTSGWLFAVTLQVEGGASGATYWEVEIAVNGTLTGIMARLTGGTMTRTPGRYPVQPSDVVTVVDRRSGALGVHSGRADVWGRLEQANAAAMS